MLFSASMGGLLLLCLLPLLRCLVRRVHALALRNQRVQHVHDVHAVLLPLGVPLTDQRQLAIVRVVPADDITPYSTVIKDELYEHNDDAAAEPAQATDTMCHLWPHLWPHTRAICCRAGSVRPASSCSSRK